MGQLGTLSGVYDLAERNTHDLSPNAIRSLQEQRGASPCFLTDARYFCDDKTCEWRSACMRFVAEWRR